MPAWAGFEQGLFHLLQWPVFAALLCGSFVGIFTGAIPGLQASVGIALLLPIIFYFPPEVGLVMLCALWMADNFGGSISAILLGIPGTPGAVFTVLDGHPMAQQGKGAVAIGIALTASAVGGVIGALLFLTLAPPIAIVALKFGPSELFLLAIVGLTLVASSTQGKIVKGLIAGGIGLLMSCIGISVLTGYPRFTFGTNYLLDHIDIVLLCLGVFAIGRLLSAGVEYRTILRVEKMQGSIFNGMRLALRYPVTLLRSGIIGALVGAVPGTGITIATPLAYQQTVGLSRHPERFGKGEPEGVAAPEAANNAVQGGALIPTLTLGIPGSVTSAVFLGGLVMYGIRIGPRIFAEQSTLVWTIWWSVIGAVVLFIIFTLVLNRLFCRVIRVHVKYLIPAIFVLAVGGATVAHYSVIDIVAVTVLGFMAYFLDRHGYPIVPLVLGFILGPLAESNFFRSIMISHGSFGIFFQGIINPILWALLILMLVLYFRGQRKAKRKQNASARDREDG